MLRRSCDYGNSPVHGFVSGATKDVAEKGEGTDLVGHQAHPGDLAGNDVGPNVEVGRREAHEDVGGGELQHHRDTLLQVELIGRVGESAGQDLAASVPSSNQQLKVRYHHSVMAGFG